MAAGVEAAMDAPDVELELELTHGPPHWIVTGVPSTFAPAPRPRSCTPSVLFGCTHEQRLDRAAPCVHAAPAPPQCPALAAGGGAAADDDVLLFPDAFAALGPLFGAQSGSGELEVCAVPHATLGGEEEAQKTEVSKTREARRSAPRVERKEGQKRRRGVAAEERAGGAKDEDDDAEWTRLRAGLAKCPPRDPTSAAAAAKPARRSKSPAKQGTKRRRVFSTPARPSSRAKASIAGTLALSSGAGLAVQIGFDIGMGMYEVSGRTELGGGKPRMEIGLKKRAPAAPPAPRQRARSYGSVLKVAHQWRPETAVPALPLPPASVQCC